MNAPKFSNPSRTLTNVILSSSMLLAWCGAAVAQTADSPPHPPHAHAAHPAKPASTGSKVLGGVAKGTNAAGHGIERAGSATEEAVNRTSERASAPIRRLGEAFGRKLSPHGDRQSGAPAVGPSGTSP